MEGRQVVESDYAPDRRATPRAPVVTDHRALRRRLSRPKHPWYLRFGAWVAAWILWIGLTLVFKSCRIHSFGDDVFERAMREYDRKVLGAIWHRNLIYIPYVFRRFHAVIMASRSRDGELVARTLERFGHLVPRGSRNDGGVRALVEMRRIIGAGNPGGLALDASVGPPYVAKAGIIRLAADTGAVILPMSWWAEPCWRLGTWDRTIVPKPFGELVFAYGEPMTVPPRLEGRDLEVFRAELELRLNRLTYQVDRWLALRDRYADPREIPVPDPVPLPVHPPRVRRRHRRAAGAHERSIRQFRRES